MSTDIHILRNGGAIADFSFCDNRVQEDEIDAKCSELRARLEKENRESRNASSSNPRNLKPHQVHDLAQAKINESEKLRKALRIKRDYEEGDHWKRKGDGPKEGPP